MNKYDFGHVLIVGGSREMVGAPVLTARAALRTGAGLVTIASAADAIGLINRDVEEMMTLSLPGWEKVDECLGKIQAFINDRHVSVVVIGPGLPEQADELIRRFIASSELPTVVDAEAFSALRGHLEVMQTSAEKNKGLILTPHPGEYARLEPSYKADEPNERAAISIFARKYHVTLVLKHARTLVANEAGEIYENNTGNAGLATAGAGDVLSGILASIVGQGVEPYAAACMAVYLHGMAGDIAANAKTEPGMIASDIIEALPAALKDMAT